MRKELVPHPQTKTANIPIPEDRANRPAANKTSPHWNVLWVCLGIVILVTGLYARTIGHDFIYCDDDQYVFENPQVKKGLAADAIKWAFTRSHAANWHPLTWLSHMLDTRLFGLNAGAHHLVNAGLHAINAVLLFLLLRMMTGAFWPSAVVAALFALHPLRVESVAWVAERKDVLSGLFFMLTLMAYTWYAKRPGILNYMGVMLLTALGLMSKSMLVTLPCLLLLLDIWPLGRWQSKNAGPGDNATPSLFSPQPTFQLILEKLPLFCMSIASSIITVVSQKAGTALGNLDTLPFAARLSNALLAYVQYIGKTIWPSDLSIFYPHPALVSPLSYSALTWQLIIAALLLICITVLVIRQIKNRPYLTIGWFWYLGTMVPVIGLVQVGMQSMADRYTYLPLLGIYIMIVWGIRDLSDHRHKKLMPPVVIAVLALFTLLSWAQIGRWKNTQTIFEHAIDATSSNYFAYNHLGRAFENKGELIKANNQYEYAITIKPDYAGAHSNLGNVFAKQKHYDKAISHLEESVRLDPGFAAGYSNLGLVYERQGRPDLALAAYKRALQLDPHQFATHYNLGVTLVKHGDPKLAAAHLEQALKLNPFHANSANDLAVALMRLDMLKQAEAVCRHALSLNPEHMDALCNLGIIYQKQGKNDLAAVQLKKALDINPRHIPAHCNLGLIYEEQSLFDLAVRAYEYALDLDSNCLIAHRKLGIILAGLGRFDPAATHLKAVLNTHPNDPDALNAMGFIYSKSGNTEMARKHFEQALRLNPDHELARKNFAHLDENPDN